MSRLSTLSPAAIRALFSPESDSALILLLTLTGGGITSPIYLADSYTTTLSSTDDDVVYGVVSRAKQFIFIPFGLTLPTEDASSAPRASIVLHDVTRLVIPEIRKLTGPPDVLIELVLSTAPDAVEASFSGLKLGGIRYNSEQITAELTAESLAIEPFPTHTFTPANFPGLF